ncbi:MAG: hypothetical protein JST66_11310 [Bacteroidetes bacterium]|nr:hypothetical protein [Bacteroidota bacterium]
MDTRVLRNHLLVLLAYAVVTFLIFHADDAEGAAMGILLVMMVLVGAHTLGLLLAALVHFIAKRPRPGRSHLLAALLVLVVGFGLCWGGAGLAGA